MDVGDSNNEAKKGYTEGFEQGSVLVGAVSLDTAIVLYDYYMSETADMRRIQR